MRKNIVIDTGVLVAYLNRREQWHDWAKIQLAQIQSPLLTCEAVIVETCFLLKNCYGAKDLIFALIKSGNLVIIFSLEKEISQIEFLMKRYENVPMSLADACLVRMSELILGSCILTLDSDFQIYRKNNDQVIDLITIV
ncbi:MAG: PIN domain-containing protein [Woronichinia naegeliana WA131]|jgi:predicted nucleic acid-binding protein|uniref:PIN domain-containing protein n=1 Tax=Woronichinia naegeliana WA131 TaxID=2824559 RepID=A0A977PZC5_9CYAN|nr:MAG: PIN domain-containing protein [Woronichinia naegeliana WA131]